MAKILLALVSLAIAILYQLETDPSYWTASSTVKLDVFSEDVMKFLTNVDQMEKWLTMVSYVRPADFRPLDVNKQYHAIYTIPWIGEYTLLFKVLSYQANRRLTLESESLFKPRIEFEIHQNKPKESFLTIRVHYRRRSVLFQYTVGPLMYFLTTQQLQQSLFTLRMLFPY